MEIILILVILGLMAAGIAAIIAFSFLTPKRPTRPLEVIDIDIQSKLNWICRSSACSYSGSWTVAVSASYGPEPEIESVTVQLIQFDQAGATAINSVLISDESAGEFHLPTTNSQFFPATGLYKLRVTVRTRARYINTESKEVFFNFEDTFQYLDFGRASGSPSVYMHPQGLFYRRAVSFLGPDAPISAIPELVDNEKRTAIIRTCPKSMTLEKVEYIAGYHPVSASSDDNLGVRLLKVSISRPGEAYPIEEFDLPRASAKELVQGLIIEDGIETLVEVTDPDRPDASVSSTTYSIAFHFRRLP